jgi:CelD/BcsL family acetyltransferase involved in cellulose biosynthesis
MFGHSELTIEEITTPELLHGLSADWSDLWHRCPSAGVFQTPEWNLAWWDHLGHGTLWTLALRSSGKLVGLAPAFIYTDPQGVRRLLLIGTSITDEMDMLLDPACEQECFTAICGHLAETSDRWDVCDWQELTHGSALLRLGRADPLASHIEQSDVCPVVPLPSTIDRFREQLPSGLRRNVTRYREKLKREGPVRFETSCAAAQLDEYMEALIRLHQIQWRDDPEKGMLQQERIKNFHRSLARAFVRRNLLRFHGLWLGESLVAVVYSFIGQHRAYSYLGGYEPSLSKYSLGTLIMGYAIEQAVLEGAREWNFLRGRELYKYNWGAKDRPNYRLLAWMR